MLLSLNLLKKHLVLPNSLTPEKIQLGLTQSTVEVEKIHVQGKNLKGIVVGRIEKIEAIPQADKLKLTTVNTGKYGQLKIVCGGSNLYEGMVSAVALPGAMVRWHGKGELVEIQKVKLRGVESEGMVCTASEIGLGNEFPHEEAEVMDLKLSKPKLGQGLAASLGFDDVIIEIDNKSLTNRPDLWSHYGIAMELAAIFGLKLKPLEFGKNLLRTKKAKNLSITVQEKKLCPRYLGAVVENIVIKESPEWLKKNLWACGLRPINNIVDITNYVLLELGQPMHAFDFEKIKSVNLKSQISNAKQISKSKLLNRAEIIVRKAKPGEKIITLDGIERKLEKEMLMIADSEKPVALAGIMGGFDTGVTRETKKIIFESANFEPTATRKTSQRLGLRTEASVRYEKSLHPNLAVLGMERALELIKEILPEANISEILDVNNFKAREQELELDYAFLVKRIGVEIGHSKVLKILKDLGFMATLNKRTGRIKIIVPWWRATGDISIPEDIVEEVARIYGYDKLLAKVELVNLEPAKYQARYDFEIKMKNLLSFGFGMTEVFNYPWNDDLILAKLNFKDKLIEILNPPTEKTRFLKDSLIFGLLQNVEDNLRFFDSFKLFELARVFLPKTSGPQAFDGDDSNKLPGQPYKIAGVVVGEKKEILFSEVKGMVGSIINLIGQDYLDSFETSNLPEYFDSKSSQSVWLKKVNEEKKMVGYFGYLRQDYLQKFDFRNRQVVLFELEFSKLAKAFEIDKNQVVKYQPPLRFPRILRDMALELDYEYSWLDLSKVINSVFDKQGSLWVRIDRYLSTFDLGNGKKSVAFRMEYSAADRTLTEKEVVEIENKILEKLKSQFGAKQR